MPVLIALTTLACQSPPDCPPNPCDANGDGQLTADDATGTDWNGDGDVGLADYNAWIAICR